MQPQKQQQAISGITKYQNYYNSSSNISSSSGYNNNINHYLLLHEIVTPLLLELDDVRRILDSGEIDCFAEAVAATIALHRLVVLADPLEQIARALKELA